MQRGRGRERERERQRERERVRERKKEAERLRAKTWTAAPLNSLLIALKSSGLLKKELSGWGFHKSWSSH